MYCKQSAVRAHIKKPTWHYVWDITNVEGSFRTTNKSPYVQMLTHIAEHHQYGFSLGEDGDQPLIGRMGAGCNMIRRPTSTCDNLIIPQITWDTFSQRSQLEGQRSDISSFLFGLSLCAFSVCLKYILTIIIFWKRTMLCLLLIAVCWPRLNWWRHQLQILFEFDQPWFLQNENSGVSVFYWTKAH